MSQSPTPQPSPSTFVGRLLRRLTHPATIAIGVGSVTVVLIGYTGLRLFLKEYLPPWLETQVSYIINRPIKIGELQDFSLTGLSLGSTSIPVTPDNPNQITISKINVKFNPLAVVFRRTLPITISPQKVDVDVFQNAQGQLLTIDVEESKLPVKLDLTFKVEKADINVFPYQKKQPLEVQFKGEARYLEEDVAKWQYDLNLALLNSQVKLQGETICSTTESNIKLNVEKLDFSSLTSFIIDFPLRLNSGNVQANLNIQSPSLKEFQGTQAQGNVNLSNLQGQVKPLTKPFEVLSNISFKNNKVLVKNAQLTIGQITAKLGGEYDWNTGSNLAVNLEGLTGRNLRQVLPPSFSLQVEGELDANFKLTGQLNKPLLKGKINNKKALTVLKTKFDQVAVNFQTNFNDFLLQNVSIKPQVGGEIRAQGTLKPNLLISLTNSQKIDWKKIPFELIFKTELPTQKLIADYYKLPDLVSLNSLTSQGRITGTLANPNGLITWQTSADLTTANTRVTNQGTLVVQNKNILVKNTELVTNEGRISFNGSGSWLTKRWQGYLSSQGLSLNPFTSLICQSKQLVCPENVKLNTANIRLGGDLNKPGTTGLNLVAKLGLTINQGTLVINSQLQQDNLTTSITGFKVPIAAKFMNIAVPITLKQSRINLGGKLSQIWQNSTVNLDAIQANSNLELGIAESTLTVVGRLEKGLLSGDANITPLSLNQFLPQVPIPVQLAKSKIEVSGDVKSLMPLGQPPNFNTLKIKGNSQFAIANGTLTAISQLNQGKIDLNATATPIILSNLLPQISTPIALKQTNVNLTGNLSDLISFNFKKFQGNAQVRLGIANGEINTSTQLINQQWNSQIIANNLDATTVNNNLLKLENLNRINAKINLAGRLNNLLSSESLLVIQAKLISVQMGQQILTANGNILVTNLWKKPDIKQVSLNLNTQANLATLPLTQLVAKLPIKRQLLPNVIELAGRANFQGNLVGKNLLTSPLSPGNLQLNGTLKLANFGINNVLFDPLLRGTVKIATGGQLSVNLTGQEDIITAVFNPCKQANCLLPYIPQSFKITQSYNNSTPIIVQGNRENNILVTQVQNFPLELLTIAPVSNYGFYDYLGGKVNINAQIDTLSLKNSGTLNILNPGLGKIVANSFDAAWVYKNDKITLENTSLKLGETRYEVIGGLNLKSGEIQGKLNVDRGYIQDILTALNISDLDSLWRTLQLKKPPLGDTKELQTESVGNRNAPLSEQVNQLWNNDQKIQAIATKRQAGDIPRQLNIRGQFAAEIGLSGTLEKPEMSLNFQGNQWQWTPQRSGPAIINPLGFVIEGAQVIPIEKLAIEGSLKEGIIQFNPSLKLGSSLTQGNLSLIYQNNQFYIKDSSFSFENLSLDTVRSLIVVPGDINGNLNLQGTLKGLLTEPKIEGEFQFSDGSIYARLIQDTFKGNFIYENAQVKVQINEPTYLQVSANLPFPIQPDINDKFQINTQIETQAFSLLETLTKQQLIWSGGEGSLDINLSGRILINDTIKISLDQTTKAILDFNNTLFQTDLFTEPLNLNGQISLQNGRLQTAQLTGTIGERTIRTIGVLPLFPDASANIETAVPFTIALTQDQVNSEGLYQGLADGRIIITGSLINPTIGGEVRLTQGKIVVPDVRELQKQPSPVFNQWIGNLRPLEGVLLPPTFNNLRILIDQVAVEQTKISPRFNLNLSGDLSLNGQLNSFSLPGVLALKPSGSVKVNEGKIDIPLTSVFLSRQYDNTITFLPEQGLLNPSIDLTLKLYILSVSLQTIRDNEIPDDLIQTGRSKSIEVNLGIQGQASELLPNLGSRFQQICQLRPEDYPPIPQSPAIPTNKLQQLAECIQINNLGANSIADLIRSPIVSFSSNPRLSNSELFTLFSQQLPNLLGNSQVGNSTQLVNARSPQIALVLLPFLQDWIFELNENINQKGSEPGMVNFRVFPSLETIYQLEGDALIRFSYDYSFNEAIIRYENKF